MTERTSEYQKKAKEYARYLKPYLGHEPTVPDSTSDQKTYEYLQRLHQGASAKWVEEVKKMPERQEHNNGSQNIRVAKNSDRVTAMDWPYGGRVQILDNGTILTDGDSTGLLNTLVAMKPLDQSLPDFLKELAKGQ